MKQSVAHEIGEHPTRFLEWAIWTLQFALGVFVASPFYTPAPMGGGGNASVLATQAESSSAILIYGLIIASIGLAGLVGLLIRKKNESLSGRLRRGASFSAFVVYSYFVLLRILLSGFGNLLWATYLMNCIMFAVIHLRLRWEND